MQSELLITKNGYSIPVNNAPHSKLMRLPSFRSSSKAWDPSDCNVETVSVDDLCDNIVQPEDVNIETDISNLVVFVGIGIKYVKEKENSQPEDESTLKAKSSVIQTQTVVDIDNSSAPPEVEGYKQVRFKAVVSLENHKQLKFLQLMKVKGSEEYIGYTVVQDDIFYFTEFRDDTLISDTAGEKSWNDKVKAFCWKLLGGYDHKGDQVAVNASQLNRFRADTGNTLQLLAESLVLDSSPWVISALETALEDYSNDESVPVKFTETMYRIVQRAPVSDEAIGNLVTNEVPICCPFIPVDYLTTDMVKDLVTQMETKRDLVVPLVHLPFVLGRYAYNAKAGYPFPKLYLSLEEAESTVGTGPGPLDFTHKQPIDHRVEIYKISIKKLERILSVHRQAVNQSLANLEFTGPYGCDLEAIMDAAAQTFDKEAQKNLLNDALRVLKLKDLTNESNSFAEIDKVLKLMKQLLPVIDPQDE